MTASETGQVTSALLSAPSNNRSFGIPFERLDANLAASTSVIEGLPDEQRTSPVRRTFLLLVLFDMILCFMLWIIYVQQTLANGDINVALWNEVVNYNFSSSLFDTVVLSFTRFLLLEIVYGAFQISVPWWTAVITGGTNLILVIKCFLFKFHQTNSNYVGFSYTVIIAALILSWIETGFLVYRVIPQERAAKHVASYFKFDEPHETQSLLSNHLAQRSYYCSYVPSVSMDFFTPQGSLFGDDKSVKTTKSNRFEADIDITPLLDRMNAMHKEMWYLYGLDAWDNSSLPADSPYTIRCASITGYPAKVYRLEALLYASPRVTLNDLVMNVDQTPSWNTSLSSVECIQAFAAENIDILHNVVNEALGGIISPRDFVLLRSWGQKNKAYFVCSTSVEHPKYPPSTVFIRANQIISACILEPVPTNPSLSKLVWILCNDFKITLPQRFIDKAMNFALPSLLTSLIKRSKILIDNPDDDVLISDFIEENKHSNKKKKFKKFLNIKSKRKRKSRLDPQTEQHSHSCYLNTVQEGDRPSNSGDNNMNSYNNNDDINVNEKTNLIR